MNAKTTVRLKAERIDEIFAEAGEQADYLIGLYREVYGEQWEWIAQVEGWPTMGLQTGEYIMQKAIDFDREHHPSVFAGGLCLNSGFRVEDGHPEWAVTPAPVKLEGE